MRNLYFFIVGCCCITVANSQIINIPDPILKAKLLQTSSWNANAWDINLAEMRIDANNNGEIERSEALNVGYLMVGSNPTNVSDYISDATGLEQFANLKELSITYNNLTTLNLSGLSQLTSLVASNTEMTSANLSQLPNLKNLTLSYTNLGSLDNLNLTSTENIETLNCNGCLLTNVDLRNFTALKESSFIYNGITEINVTGITTLEKLSVQNNPLTAIDLTTLPNVKYLDAAECLLPSLDVSQNPLLTHLYLRNNQLTTLDLSNNFNFFYLDIRENNLTSLFIKNGRANTIQVNDNPNLAYICADESELSNGMLLSNPLTQINSYCSFVPGGTYYTVSGSNSFDSDNDGCDTDDIAIPHLRVAVTNNTTTGAVIANNSGNYSIPVSSGNYILTPSFENSGYFNVTPPNLVVTFPADVSPYSQHFCITANGIHPDLEIFIMQLTFAMPGFDCSYKILFKNKGNQIQSGTVNFTYSEDVLDFVSAEPTIASQASGQLNWNFNDLNPFETREIFFVLHSNSPMDTPAVNNGDIFSHTALITGGSFDETPTDNMFSFNQTVTNSFDPNDKTCLEGTTITPDMAGKYVHYKIRFENTGTANAQNIVVKDVIDTTKFGINSLIPINGSHSFVTKISNGNKVEFIFENINLPFEDANNDGYVVFKIKTNPMLVLGDSFSNSASIYFDYNFPIVTEPAVTTFAVLGTKDFEFSDYFTLHPNPAGDVLNIQSKKQTSISSVSIYNMLGQLVLVNTNINQSKPIDISVLKFGNYFIKIQSDKGISHSKFIKQ